MNQKCQFSSFIEQYFNEDFIDMDTNKKLLGLSVIVYFKFIEFAYIKSRYDVVNHLINNHSFNVNQLDKYGRTLLHVILDRFNPKIGLIELLLEHGADPTILDRYNQTPLDLYKGAADIIDEKIINLLNSHTWPDTKEPDCE